VYSLRSKAFIQACQSMVRQRVRRAIRARYSRQRDACHDLHDLVQDVMLHLYLYEPKILAGYDPDAASWWTWVTRIVDNAISSCLRKQRKTSRQVLEAADDGPLFAQIASDSDPSARLRQYESIERLRRRAGPKSVHILDKILQGWDVPEIAAEMKLTPDAVHSAYGRLRALALETENAK
jgi:RNA polymerase sigma factor (sigma-70 family)